MNSFLSKFSLYDFLTTILLGGCLFFSLRINGWGYLLFNHLSDIGIAAVCYILGLFVHKSIECIDVRFKKMSYCKIAAACHSPLCRNQPMMIKDAMIANDIFYHDSQIMDEYYFCYYWLMFNGKLNNIPRLEAQSAFIRDMVFILLPMGASIVCLYWGNKCDCWIIAISFLFIEFCLVAVRYNTEKKIHNLVWETYKYAKIAYS